ncbi:MAG: glycosyltransferase family 4 protein [Acidobacteria bacterium]|nr:glycosyltransferase family 4 protein [Acidobacteriota bacterium]MBS1865478.1 glycosyltransferase family 4 protein [Acidobacteriota bacterium]
MSAAPPASSSATKKPRLLVVPHIFAEDISIREIEFARRLTDRFEVFVLKWNDALHVDASSPLKRRLRQFFVAASSAFHSYKTLPLFNGFTPVELPVWQPILLRRLLGLPRAHEFCKTHNRAAFGKVLAAHSISHILYANELFGTGRIPNIRSAFDVVDWFPENEHTSERLAENRANLRRVAENMDAVFAVSEPLCEKLARECSINPLPLPNGADLAKLRSVPAEKSHALRAKLGLENRFVIGYIGNHGPFTGVDLVVNAFLAARNRLPDASLLIVGPAHCWQSLLDNNRDNGVVATGGVSPAEIATYFNALDVGVLAQGITTGTDFAFQIKVVEYSACRKIVVSTPLETWKRLSWPNVLLAEPNPAAWADAFVKARGMAWQSGWDRFVEPYDWSILSGRIADALLAPSAQK